MVKGKQVTQTDRQRVLQMSARGGSSRSIAAVMGLSKSVVCNIVREVPNKRSAKKRGRKIQVTERTRRRVLQTIRKNRQFGMRSISSLLGGVVSKSTVWRIKSASNFSRRKFKRRPTLRDHHREARIRFGVWFLMHSEIVDDVIWSDEKRFSLDGPDGYQFYWWEKGRGLPEDMFKIDSFGKRGIMVHIAMSVKGVISVERMLGTITGQSYSEFLTETLLPRVRSVHEDGFIFQHDNASPHTAQVTLDTLEEENIEVLDWPALSPDLNPVENLWSMIARKVYTAGVQYENEGILWNAVQTAAKEVPIETCVELANSLPERIQAMMLKRGGYAQ